MHQPRGEANLPIESIGAGGDAKLGPQDLQGYVTVALEVAREVDDRHAASAQLALDPVALCQTGAKVCDGIRGGA